MEQIFRDRVPLRAGNDRYNVNIPPSQGQGNEGLLAYPLGGGWNVEEGKVVAVNLSSRGMAMKAN